MASKTAPVSGSLLAPVNAMFAGPDKDGLLYSAPPLIGVGAQPIKAVNGVDTPKLGVGNAVSPKTHG